MHRLTVLLTGLLCIGTCGTVPLAGREPTSVRTLKTFSAQDYRGRTWTEQDFAEAPVLVVAFLGVECPLAKLYGPRLQKLANEYAERGVRFVAVDANRQDALTEMAAYARQHELTMPFVKDVQGSLAEALGAERTPEVFVLDRQREVRYWGRIDDQHAVGGRSKPKPTQEDLRGAIEAVLRGERVPVPHQPAVGCLIGRPRPSDPSAEVTYTKHIAPLLQAKCVECHRPGEIAPFSLTEYAEVAGWADMILEVTTQRRMPPWHANPHYGRFANENRLTEEQLRLIRAWVAAGAPEGDPADLPPPRQFTQGWQLQREPDLVVAMSPKPFRVPAEGEVKYQYFLVDPGLKEDVWINAAEVVPGNRAVVHHVIVFNAGDGRIVDDDRQLLVAYVPGLRVTPLPPGMAKHVAAGSKFIFQMHYTPIGTEQLDLTKVGLYFVDPREVTHKVQTISTRSRTFRIEPMKDDQRFTTVPVTAPVDLLLLSMSPHMHLRGKSFRYEATWPNGQTEILLDVPHYDFNWQTAYRLAEPRSIPRGTKLVGYASFDNSPNNLANPDPTATVFWGDQSWEEMMIGYADVAIPVKGADTEHVAREIRRSTLGDFAGRLFQTLDKNADGKIERDEVEPRWKARFERVDQNGDGIVTREELDRSVELLRRLQGQ